jgi:hypothetical protein
MLASALRFTKGDFAMNTTTPSFFRRLRWSVALTIVALIGTLLLGACGKATEVPSTEALIPPTSTSVPPTPTPVPPTETPVPPTPTPISPTSTPAPATAPASKTIEEIAEDVAVEVGQVTQVIEGAPDRLVIVFEETHDSLAGQVEIAIMLNRLYEDYDLRHIGLEGAFAADGVLDEDWFQAETPFKARDLIRDREDVIVQMLEDGEISSSEMMALIYEDVEVVGIEDADEYNVKFPEDASGAPTIYLYLIAIPGLTEDEVLEANELLEAEEILEAVEFIISTDPFTDETYKWMNDDSVIRSAEEWVEMMDEIQAKAAEVGVEIEADVEADLEAYREFFATASQRSDTMVDYVLDLAETQPEKPIAMITGAAHTERVIDLLEDAGVSAVVLRANSLAEGLEKGDLSFEAYDRKLQALSVDAPGSLGALLDGRKKPPTVTQQLWFQVKAKIYLVVTRAARAIAEGHSIDELEGMLPTYDNVTFRPIEMDGDELIFEIETVDNNNDPITIYGRAVVNKDATEQLLVDRLSDALEMVQSEEAPDPAVEESQEVSEPTVKSISSDTIATFSKDQSAIKASRLGS